MKKTFFILIVLACSNISFAQIFIDRQVIGSAGHLTNIGAIIASSNIGETITTTCSSASIIVTQGFEQSDSIIPTSINWIDHSNDDFLVYPNPTSGDVIIENKMLVGVNFKITLFNLFGQIMEEKEFQGSSSFTKTSLNMEQFVKGAYFLKIISEEKIFLFKIQKL